MIQNSQNIAEKILYAVRKVLPLKGEKIALHEPEFDSNEWDYVRECLDTGWVSSVGKFVDRFEGMLRAYTGSTCAVATVNGTAALHVALILAGVSQNDEVLVPALTFVATANAVTYCGAIPHFVDSEYSTLGLDAVALEQHLDQIAERKENTLVNRITGRTIRAVVPMHTFGHPVNVERLNALCEKFSLPIVEDAAESVGSTYRGKHTGRFGLVSALSFNGNKIVTTGGGGAILTDDEELGHLAKHLTTTARVPHRWAISHDRTGFNYRLPNLNAALGCAQLEALPNFVVKKRQLAQFYMAAFAGMAEATFVKEPEGAKSNYWLNAILLAAEVSSAKDDVLERLNNSGIVARPSWTLMHRLPMYQDCPRAPLPVAEDIERRLINLPSSAKLA